jgi:hypothetical protein
MPTAAAVSGFLKQPSIVYGAVLLLAMGSTLCAGWGTKILLYGSGIDDFKPLFYASCSLPPSSPLRHS